MEQAGPVTFLAAAPDASWLAYCSLDGDTNGDGRVEAPVGPDGELGGDALTAKLQLAGREPLAIDELLASASGGRFLLLRMKGAHYLYDAQGEVFLELEKLGADVRRDASPLPGHRAISFDHSGKRLLYLHRSPRELELVVRDLASGAERRLSTGVQEAYRLEVGAGDHYAVLHAVSEDTNKNGRLDWPMPVANAPSRVCQGPLPRLPARYPNGDRAVKVVVPLQGGAPEVAADLVTPLGSSLVRRTPSGELVVDKAGTRVTLASATCSGRVLHAEVTRELVLVGCRGKKAPGRAAVQLVRAGSHKPLNVAVQPTELDAQAVTGGRLLPLYPGADALLIDSDTGESHALEAGDLVLATHGARALIRRRDGLWLYDVDSRAGTKLDTKIHRLPHVVVRGPWVFVSPALVNLEQGNVLGGSPHRPLAISDDGKLLIAEGGAASAERLARGPLRWVTAQAEP